MTGQKGGLKDRVKTWKIIYRQKRADKLLLQDAIARQKRLEKKKRQELELQYRLTWKERTMAFFHTALGLFIGLFQPRQRIQEKKVVIEIKPGKNIIVDESDAVKLESYQKEVNYIHRKMDAITQSREPFTREKIEAFKQNIEKKSKTLEGIRKDYEETKTKYKKSYIKKDEVSGLLPAFQTNHLKVAQPVRLDESIKKAEASLLSAGIAIEKKEKEVIQGLQKEAMIQKRDPELECEITDPYKNMDGIEDINLNVTGNSIGEIEPAIVVQYIKKTNLEIKKYAKEIEKLSKLVVTSPDKNTFQIHQQNLTYLRTDIEKMIQLHRQMDRTYGFYRFDVTSKAYQEDKFKLLTGPGVLDGMIEEIDHTQALSYQEKKDQKKKGPEKEKEPKEKPKTNTLMEELDEAEELVAEQINRQRQEIDSLQYELSMLPVERKIKHHAGFVSRMIANVGKIVAGAFSFSFFKHKAVGLLTGAFLINNGIRGLKKAIQPDEKVEYYDVSNIKNRINHQKDCLLYAEDLLEDAKGQLTGVKKSFMRKFESIQGSKEYREGLARILEMEEVLEGKRKQISEQKSRLTKEKNKVKKLEKKGSL